MIKKNFNIMRKPISPSERLSIKLCYMAIENTFKALKFIRATSPQSISSTVLETCEALICCFKGLIKVRGIFKYEEFYFLAYIAMKSIESQLTFPRKMWPPS
jgi:hypothetical protein